MGITWRIAMPLLSTLAALVIIVHSAEENLDRGHRYDLRPRVLDTRPSQNEQPWRVVRADPAVQQAAPPRAWSNEDDPPVRRRVGRKRKRRPPSSSSEADPAHEEHQQDFAEPTDQNTETPVKRRKKARPNRKHNESDEQNKPIRRRGQRRRRPSLETWPELSEFGSYPRDIKLLEKDRETMVQTDLDDDEVGNERYLNRGLAYGDDDITEIRVQTRRPSPLGRFVIAEENRQNKPLPTEDKSLSEFSMEVMGPLHSNSDGSDYEFREVKDKMKDKSSEIFYTMDKAKETGPIDPNTLKEILKRSNGTSLSEILHQHNLTLADLLNGKENAISLLKSGRSLQKSKSSLSEEKRMIGGKGINKNINEELTTIAPIENVEFESVTEQVSSNMDQNINREDNSMAQDFQTNSTIMSDPMETTEENVSEIKDELAPRKQGIEANTNRLSIPVETANVQQRTSGMVLRRPTPVTMRRKLRMRPIVNNTYKSQINRDMMALSARRYVHHNRRNVTKGKEWKKMIPLMVPLNVTEEIKPKQNKSITTTSKPEEETTTTIDIIETTETTVSEEPVTVTNVTNDEILDVNNETTTIAIEILETELDFNVTEKPIVTRPPVSQSGLRRQSYNNRLKKKRMRQKTSTTETPQDDIMKNILELGDLVSSSEFITRTQIPKATSPDDRTETATELEDFLTTQAVTKSSLRSTRFPSTRKSSKSTTVTKTPILTSTEETAKIEIEEILNDTRTSSKLSKILRERNMTLTELLEHRERGSSHVHLADIFHNASKEPNPAEPFLSKSFIEPISKETYPLRALLDANLHEPTTKPTTIDPIITNHINIPVIMDFGNNVNENAENMGIMSLFHNFTKNAAAPNEEESTIQKDSKGVPYKSTVTSVNATDDEDDTTRESRMLEDDEDMISWNEIFSMIRKNHKNETKVLEKLTSEISPTGIHKKITLEEDIDGDGVIVLEDLQHIKDLEGNAAAGSEEKIEFNTLEKSEVLEPGILNKTPNNAKSVTVATASIVGLAMILFLLTYAALKWRQQRTVSHKKAFCDERIPSPVFENRKGSKNCSSRSISPMLPTSNIYTMNTLESQTGKDSPEYMWDSLRKPFQ